MPQLPKQYLRIRDAVFILPDDFDGEVPDAMALFLQHLMDNQGKPVKYSDPNGVYTPLGVVLALAPDKKASYDSAIYKLIGDTHYIEMPKRRSKPKEKSSDKNNEEES
ncbi:MAG: hypothetical protein NC548_06445 [Lachnospiraceae bacterium]|nr:hypothetical protein [Lachnospiraceae bacterium]